MSQLLKLYKTILNSSKSPNSYSEAKPSNVHRSHSPHYSFKPCRQCT